MNCRLNATICSSEPGPDHPDVVYQLRYEFHTRWKAIDPLWRTDNEKGRQNVIDFLVAEPLKALLDANVTGPQLWPFMCELIDQASYLNVDAFIREVYTHEQVAQSSVDSSSAAVDCSG